ncbi:MAG: hypothetical protein ACOYVJ_02885 [Nitrospirota bacterium]
MDILSALNEIPRLEPELSEFLRYLGGYDDGHARCLEEFLKTP